MNNIPSVWIDEQVLAKIFTYIDIARGEIGGLGTVIEYPQGLFITDAFLFKQKTSEVETTLDTMAIASLMSEMLREGRDIGTVRLWWHSHGDYEVGWSREKDEVTIGNLSKKKYLLSIVGNKKRYYLARYDFAGFSIDVPLLRYKTVGAQTISRESLAREVAEKVTFQKEKKRTWRKPITLGK